MSIATRRGLAVTLAGLLVLALAAVAWAAARAPSGALTRLAGSGACLGPGGGCGRLRGPTGLLRLAISPDGRTLYASGQAGGLAVLRRDASSGRLRQLAGTAGCLRRDGAHGCARMAGLVDPGAIAISPDGASLYVTTSTGVEAFARNAATGALRPIGCLDAAGAAGCGSLRAPAAPTALLAAGNRTVYAAGATTDAQGDDTGAIAVLTRDPRTGALRQGAGAGACLDDDGSHGCAVARCVDQLTALALNQNATRLFTGSTNSLAPQATLPGDVATFARNRGTGALTLLGCQTRRAAISDVHPVPRSRDVLVATLYGNRGTAQIGGSLDLYRPGRRGVLARVRKLACVARGRCPIPYYTNPARLALRPNGNTVYVAVSFGGITVLRHGAHGVSVLPGRAGCIVSATHINAPRGCAQTGPEIGGDLLVSPDGRDLYVGTLGPSHTQYYAGGLETFRIAR